MHSFEHRPSDNLITSVEAGKRFGYTNDYVAKLAREGTVQAIRVGRDWYVDQKSLGRFAVQTAAAKRERAARLRDERKREFSSAAAARTDTAPKEVAALWPRRTVLIETGALMALGVLLGAFLFVTTSAPTIYREDAPNEACMSKTTIALNAAAGNVLSHITSGISILAREFWCDAASWFVDEPCAEPPKSASSDAPANVSAVPPVPPPPAPAPTQVTQITNPIEIVREYREVIRERVTVRDDDDEVHLVRYEGQVEQIYDDLGESIDGVYDAIDTRFGDIGESFATDLLTVSGNASVGGTLAVTGATTLSSTLQVAGDTTLTTLTAAQSTTTNATSTTLYATTVRGLDLAYATAALGTAVVSALNVTAASSTNFFTDRFVATAATTTDFVTTRLAVDSFTLGAGISSHFVPSANDTYDLGSPSFFWRNGYIDTITTNSISAASTSIGGTNSESLTLNADNATMDTEDMHLIFYRGSVVPNAVLSWKAALDRFEFNQPAYIENQSGSTTQATLTLRGLAGQTGNLFQVASSSGDTVFSVATDGSVAISTTTIAALTSGTTTLTNLAVSNTSTSTFAGGVSMAGLAASGPTYLNSTLTVLGLADLANGFVSRASSTISGDVTLTGRFFDATGAQGAAGMILSSTGNGTGWVSTSTLATSLNAFVQGGNAFAGLATLGTNDVNALAFETNNVERMRIDAAGNVGVGTTSPMASLSVAGAGNSGVNIGGFFGSGYGAVALNGTADATNYNFLSHSNPSTDNALYINRRGGGAIQFREANGTSQVTIASGGNVSIGVTTPQAKLDIQNSSSNSPSILNLRDTFGTISLELRASTSTLGNTFVGRDAGRLVTTGDSNSAFGREALNSNLTGADNSAFGRRALFVSTGSSNSAFGSFALSSNSTGSNNAAFGLLALGANNAGTSSTGIGSLALRNNTAANSIVAVGYAAGQGNASYSNQGGVYVGFQAGLSATSNSNFNTFLGYQAGYDNTSGSNNIVVGPWTTTGAGITTGSNNILIGQGVRSGLTQTGSNQLNIGNLIFGTGLGSGSTLASGNVGIGTTNPLVKMHVAGGSTSALGELGSLLVTGSTNAMRLAAGVDNTSTMYSWLQSVENVVNSRALALNPIGGNVGIGTTTPSGKLSIIAVDQNTLGLLIGNSTYSGNGFNGLGMQVTNAGTAIVRGGWNTAQNLVLNDNGGNVGIGTTNPTQRLTITGTTTSQTEHLLKIGNSADNRYMKLGVLLSGDGNQRPFLQSYHTSSDANTWDFLLNPLGGSVGIGTTTPAQKLDVNGSIRGNAAVFALQAYQGGNATEQTSIGLTRGGGATDQKHWEILHGNDNSFQIRAANEAYNSSQAAFVASRGSGATVSAVSLLTSGSNRLHIDSVGNVGINKTNPAWLLNVRATGVGTFPFVISKHDDSATGFYVEEMSTGDFNLRIANTSNVATVLINSNGTSYLNGGNVGIGTSSPSSKLNVYGSASGAQDTGILDVSVNGGGSGDSGLSMGYDATNNWSWLYSRTVGIDTRPIALFAHSASIPTLFLNNGNGNVGIGTMSPKSVLDIQGGSAVSGPTLGTQTGVLGIGSWDKKYGTYVGVAGNGDTWFQAQRNDGNTATYNLLFNPSGGNVGIGTASPTEKLSILSADNAFNTNILAVRANNLTQGVALGYASVRAIGTNTNVDLHLQSQGTGAVYTYTNGSIRTAVHGNGNVGIGTTDPQRALDVTGAIRASNEMQSTNNIAFRQVFGNYGLMHYTDGSNYYMLLTNAADQYGGWNSLRPLRVSVITGDVFMGNDALTVKHGGNVGIGMTGPGEKLEIAGSALLSNNNAYKIKNSSGTAVSVLSVDSFNTTRLLSGGGPLHINPDQTSVSTYVNYNNGGSLILGNGSVRSDFAVSKGIADIYAFADGVDTLRIRNSTGTKFFTFKPETATDEGQFFYWTGAGTGKLNLAGSLRFSSYGAGTLTTDASGNVTASSDERLKDIQGAFTKGLEAVLAIDPIDYKWKGGTGFDTASAYTGFSAQNVRLSIPEAVGEDPKGYLTLSDRPILAAAVNAIKELNLRIVGLTDAIAAFAHELVTERVVTQELCTTRSNGTRECITGDELADLLESAGGSASGGSPSGASSQGGQEPTTDAHSDDDSEGDGNVQTADQTQNDQEPATQDPEPTPPPEPPPADVTQAEPEPDSQVPAEAAEVVAI